MGKMIGKQLTFLILVQNVFLIFVNKAIFVRGEPMLTETLVYVVGPWLTKTIFAALNIEWM